MGVLSSIKSQSSEIEFTGKILEKEHIIMGSDISCALLYKDLLEQNKSVVWMAEKTPHTYWAPSPARGEGNISFFEKFYPTAVGEEMPSLFYKDKSFHTFSGGKRSLKLGNGEEFFTQDSKKLKLHFEIDDLNIYSRPIKMDFDERWKIFCENGHCIEGDQLYFGGPLEWFYQLWMHKEDFSPQWVEELLKNRWGMSLEVRFWSEEQVSDKEGTLFLPLSREGRHFMGEFFPQDIQGNWPFSFVCLLNDNETSNDEISRKLRLLRRLLKKTFPKYHKNNRESIIVSMVPPCPDPHDKLFELISQKYGHLNFLGPNAPISEDVLKDWGMNMSPLGMARSLATYQMVKESL